MTAAQLSPEQIVQILNSQPGTYALVLLPRRTETIRIGRLGELQLQAGFYVYVGSALGPGGVRARLHHHLHPSERPHWHIDYLKAHVEVEELWYCHARHTWEHQWARNLGTQPRASIPLAGFGSSDCNCESHLYYFPSCPSRTAFARSVQALDAERAQVRLLRLE